MTPASNLIRALFGPADAWSLTVQSRRASADLAARLREALARTPAQARACDDQPIFILSAGWRSGSTLLQRMLMEHNPDLVVWGEPYDHSNIYDGMANQFRSFTAEWPRERFFLSKRDSKSLSHQWVANLYPDVEYLLRAHRCFFNSVFGEAARATGRNRWGIKEVRLTLDHAVYFRALYPKSKILFLYRNPHDAYLSYRSLDAAWFRRWPDDVVKTPFSFGRHWAETTCGFMAGWKKVDGLLVRYEDLDSAAEVARIEQYLGWRVSRSSGLQRCDMVGSRKEKGTLPRIDTAILNLVTGQTRRDAGYP